MSQNASDPHRSSLAVSRSRPQALYQQVLNEFRRKIESGEWAANERVPSERDLSTALGVSRITVRHAIQLAVREGLLSQSHGVGTFVSSKSGPMLQELAEVRTFEQTLHEQGYTASTQIVHSAIVPGDISLSRTLGLDNVGAVYNLQLVGFGDDQPVVFYDSYFPLDIGRAVSRTAESLREKGVPFSSLNLYDFTGDGRAPREVLQSIEATTATPSLAETLRLTEGDAILDIESLMVDDLGTLEFRRAYYRSDRYKFVVRRKIGAEVIDWAPPLDQKQTS